MGSRLNIQLPDLYCWTINWQQRTKRWKPKLDDHLIMLHAADGEKFHGKSGSGATVFLQKWWKIVRQKFPSACYCWRLQEGPVCVTKTGRKRAGYNRSYWASIWPAGVRPIWVYVTARLLTSRAGHASKWKWGSIIWGSNMLRVEKEVNFNNNDDATDASDDDDDDDDVS